MTPYEFGCRVKLAVETGGLFEWMGQGADNGVKSFNKAIGSGLQTAGNAIGAMLPTSSPQAWGGSSGGGGGAMPLPPAAAPTGYTMGSGATPSAPMPAHMRAPTPQPTSTYRMGSGATPSVPPPAVKPTPRPAAAPAAPAQPKPSAPGVRKPSGRVI